MADPVQVHAVGGVGVTFAVLHTMLQHEGINWHTRKLYRWLKQHDIPRYRVGNTLLIPPDLVYARLGITAQH